MKLGSRSGTTPVLRPGGVYLITGGLGGIGLAMAEYLAQNFKARLVLVGRSALPPRDNWEQILATHSDDDGIGRRIRCVKNLEDLGTEVLILKADVSDDNQMFAAVEKAVSKFGVIHGVIHTAGVPPSGLIRLKTHEGADSVMAPKVRGTLVLENVLRGLSLDFLVLFSSMSSATGGGPGQVDYCAANAFIDSYARRNFSKHGMTISIAWGEWLWDAWHEGLLGFPEEARAFFIEKRHKFGISFDNGMEAFSRILSRKLPNTFVATQDFQGMVNGSKNFTIANILGKIKQFRKLKSTYSRPVLSTSFVAPQSEIEKKIALVWADLLGIDQIGIHDNFFELGGNSLLGIDLITSLRTELNVEKIPAYALYEAPTISTLAKFLDPKEIKSKSGEEWLQRSSRRREKLKQLRRNTQKEAR